MKKIFLTYCIFFLDVIVYSYKIRDGIIMNEFVNKLVGLLEPTILDLNDKLNELSNKSEYLKEVSEMLEKVDGDVKKVGSYENQDLILNNLNNINTNETEYKACCYLLNSNDEGVRSLPQYIESSNYIERLINFFKKRKEELELEISELDIICNNKKVNKKYLEIFKEEEVIYDTSEFKEFLSMQELNDNDKIHILEYVIKNNVDGYLKEERVKGR